MLMRDDSVRKGIRSAMLQHRYPTIAGTLEGVAANGYDMRETAALCVAPVRIVPAFAADMVLLLKSHLGPLSLTDANVLLVNTEYHRVCRGLSVRYVDQAVHRQHVVNAFFTEDVFDVVGQTRSRLPRWLRLLLGHKGPAASIAC